MPSLVVPAPPIVPPVPSPESEPLPQPTSAHASASTRPRRTGRNQLGVTRDERSFVTETHEDMAVPFVQGRHRPRKSMSHVIAGRMLPLLVIRPLFVTQVDPTM